MSAGARSAERRACGASACAAAALALLAYAPAIGNGFVWDDVAHLVDLAPGVGDAAGAAPAQPGGRYQRPLVFLSYAGERRIWGAWAAGAHLVNACLHALNAALLVVAARLSGVGPRTALAGAAVFALHPLQTEAVAYVSGRTDLLMTAAALLGLVLLLAEGRPAARGLGAAAAAAAAMLSKESGFALVGLWPYVAMRRTPAWPDRIRLAVPALAVAAGLLLLRGGPGSGVLVPAGLPQAAAAGWAVLGYLGLLVWPADLQVDRLTPLPAGAAATVVGLAALALAAAAAIRGVTRRGPVGLWSAWATAFYLPVANLLVLYPAIAAGALFTPEHNLYAPLAGIGMLAAEASRRLAARAPAAWRRPASVAVVAVMALWTLRTMWRLPDWRDESRLFGSAVAAGSRSPRVWFNFGNGLLAAGQPAAAAEVLETAARLAPGDAAVWMNLAVSRQRLGQLDPAHDAYRRAAALAPADALVWENLGTLAVRRGDRDAARSAFRRALAIDPARARSRRALELLR